VALTGGYRFRKERNMSDEQIPEGSAFFKAIVHGAVFKWMELVQAEAPQELIDAQGDFIALMKAVVLKVEEIERLGAAQEIEAAKEEI
jgi:hypothetical protein